MKKKILFVITKSNWGGAQRYVFDLANTLPKEGFEVKVALGGIGAKDARPGRLNEKLKENGIHTIFINSFMRDISFSKELKALGELTEIFKVERPDIVHLNSSKAGGLGALAARRAGVRKIVYTSHGLPHDEDRNVFARGFIWLATWATFLMCTDVIVISTDNERRAKKMPFCKQKIKLVHNGVEPISFLERADARAQLSEKIDIVPNASVWIGTIANLEWNKGLHYLVRAAGELKRKGVDFVLFVIGEGGERVFLETLISDEDLTNCVFLPGFIEGASNYLRAFDIYTLTSSKEGLPYVLMEAGLAGLPCVASDIPAVRDIIPDNSFGLLFKTRDHRDLAEQILTMIKSADLKEKTSEALKKRVAQEFSITHMVENTKRIYA